MDIFWILRALFDNLTLEGNYASVKDKENANVAIFTGIVSGVIAPVLTLAFCMLLSFAVPNYLGSVSVLWAFYAFWVVFWIVAFVVAAVKSKRLYITQEQLRYGPEFNTRSKLLQLACFEVLSAALLMAIVVIYLVI